ncbi:MAG: tetratricopeptide repeat protein, partial [Candidatus Omnitrophica bacterium]|nr:tetratricopeptide repeat protein [Candidatus Omnitrophota bacterium]
MIISSVAYIYADEDPFKELSEKVAEFHQKHKHSKAINMAEQVLMLAEEKFGKEHFFVTKALNTLAILYHEQGEYVKAEAHYRKLLNIKMKHFV